MAELEDLLRPRPDPAAVPPPVGEIAARARRRTVVRRSGLGALAVVAVAASAWGVARIGGPGDSATIVEGPAATAAPSTTATPSTTVPPPVTTAAPGPTEAAGTTPPSSADAPDAAAPSSGPPSTSTPAVEPVLAATIEDGDIGTSAGTVEYTGPTWTRCGDCNIPTPDSSYRYAYAAGESFTVRFTGVRLVVHAPDDRAGGVADVTVDGRPAATPSVDYRAASAPQDGARWDSGVLPDGTHEVVFTARAGADEVVLFDRADVYVASSGA